MPEIEFHVNEFRTYEVQVDGVSFGFIDTASGGYYPSRGEKFKYDGTTVVLKDGREFTGVPQLRSAVREGWCVVVGNATTIRKPRSANIQVRSTTHHGTERPVKTVPQTEFAEDEVVLSVGDRQKRREAANADAVRKIALESDEGRQALAAYWDSGDPEINHIAEAITQEMDEWLLAQEESVALEDEDNEIKARAEADILSLFAIVEEDAEEQLRSKSRARQAARKTPSRRPRPPVSNLPAEVPSDLRTLPVDVPDERMTMPIVKEDVQEHSGTVVGSVLDREDSEITLDLAPSTPPKKEPPTSRMGNTGALIIDEQRHMGDIALSSNAAPIRLEDSAKVKPASTEVVKMGDVQVGPRQKVAHPVDDQGGIAVGRVLSPTTMSFEANERNTSSTAISHTEQGRSLKVEKFQVEADETEAKGVATGDVQEVRTGDDLEDLLPDAAKGPAPKVYKRPEEDPAYAAVRMMIPNFEWNKDRKVEERVADALKHYKDPNYIKGILAVETEVAREAIKKALAEFLAKQKKKAQKTG